MDIFVPQVVGFGAVAMFLLSYQQKKRRNIILTNVISRTLYIIQYLLLGAVSGAVLDVLGIFASFVASRKHVSFVKEHRKVFFFFVNGIILIGGLGIALNNKSWLDLFPMAGVFLHTNAFWFSDEKIIRRVSLLGSPCWFVYNFLSSAYGAAIGDILTMISIITAMIKFKDFKD